MSRTVNLRSAILVFAAIPCISFAAEYPVGSPQIEAGMEVAAVYLQPVEMEPPGMMLLAADSDIHLEADIHATAENRNGFAEGDWVPNLHVEYKVRNIDSGREESGALEAMVASDGPHYGDNVKLSGPGRYALELTVHPGGHGAMGFGRHVDKETGVAPWPDEFTLKYEFVFAGIGKKGGY
ncbi:iron transporter [Rhizobium hidalgonense]|uniref:iron transporter n=1 Tax=Rhizobium hidalgonense TaxID=1538159 RepID=UPI0028727CEE|nr:iron transporter [Rhizobium hidalgonense]MDR9804668.1 iron transporter [Rhizobium hidalgonense]